MSEGVFQEVASKYDVIVVEGYDGVGKSTFIRGLLDTLGAKVYRPNYNYWQTVGLAPDQRWIIGASFFDFVNSGTIDFHRPLIIDRGILSAMVYNSPRLGKGYLQLIKDSNLSVLHVIVSTDRDSYDQYKKMRGVEGAVVPYEVVVQKTKLFVDYAVLLGLDYLTVSTKYSEDYARLVRGKCGSCGHYSYGVCKHPLHEGQVVSADQDRCDESTQKEVQDT